MALSVQENEVAKKKCDPYFLHITYQTGQHFKSSLYAEYAEIPEKVSHYPAYSGLNRF